jgi:glycosyltransferase involved in cell wall biosynthesis
VSVLLDIQAVQSPAHGERGIARYVLNVAQELERGHPGLVSRYLLNPTLPVPSSLESLFGSGRVRYADRVAGAQASVYHIASPIEHVPLERLVPRYTHTRGMRVVVTLYDLIPKLFPDVYLSHPATLAWYGLRLEILRRADRILAISEATARDAIAELGVPEERVVVVGAGVSGRFKRPASRELALRELQVAMPWLEQGFVLYTGGIEPRKNIDRLLAAYAALPANLRDRHQLVVICSIQPGELAEMRSRLRELGVADRVHFPGFVTDADLVKLYQACELFVFPSLYEGFGLPIAEAIACGAPVISSNTSSLPELVRDAEALFDPRDEASIRAALERALTEEALLPRLRAVELDPSYSWSAVADRTAAVYEELLAQPRRARRRRKRIAFVSPLPPARSGIADESSRLLVELAREWDVDAFADQEDAHTPAGVNFEHIRRFDMASRACGGYDRVIVCLGNSEHHAQALALLGRCPAIVIAHDVRLTGLYSWIAANRPDLEPRGFYGALHAMYGGRFPGHVGLSGWLDVGDYDRYGILMAREVIAAAERYLVHSEYAADLARLDAAPGDEQKIGVLPFGMVPPEDFAAYPRRNGTPLVATFGIVGPAKQPETVLESFARLVVQEPAAELVFAGPIEHVQHARLSELANTLGVSGRTRFTGELSEDEFYRWISKASIAVQLRSASNGETSGTITRCLAAGVPTCVTAIGPAKELPDDAVVRVEQDVSPDELAHEIGSLLRDPARQAKLSEGGLRYVRANSFARTAEALKREVDNLEAPVGEGLPGARGRK